MESLVVRLVEDADESGGAIAGSRALDAAELQSAHQRRIAFAVELTLAAEGGA